MVGSAREWPVECFRCDREAVRECPRCGALYCDEHGEALCERCMDPALALPSYRVYRGSLVALLAGTLFAVWLLVRPPATTDADSPPPAALAGVIATPTATPEAGGDQPSAATPTATAATPTPTATPEPTATPPPEQPGVREHTVAEGDTLYSIALLYLPRDKNLPAFVEEIAALNEISDANSIVLGQLIRVPVQ